MHVHTPRSSGFTLVELAIVLMIIGLLIGGILKGQELIQNARITMTVQRIKNFDAAAISFMDSYGARPGDITNPSTRLPNCSAAQCNIAGDGNGIIGTNGSTQQINSSNENNTFWVHLAAANLISGVDTNATWTPPNYGTTTVYPVAPIGGKFSVQYFNHAANAYHVQGRHTHFWAMWDFDSSNNVIYVTPVTIFARMDRKMDDGKPFTGTMVAAGSDCGMSAGATEYIGSSSSLCAGLVEVSF
jgi:prepilin-type N-terminal cleavage/methylation domain-containing protein